MKTSLHWGYNNWFFIAWLLLARDENGLACTLPLTQFGVCGVCVPVVSLSCPLSFSPRMKIFSPAPYPWPSLACVSLSFPLSFRAIRFSMDLKILGEKNIVSICHAQKSSIILYPTALNWHLYSRGCLSFLFNRLGCIEHSALHCNVDYSTTYMQSWAFEQVFALRHATTC